MTFNDASETPAQPTASDSGLHEMRVRRGSPSVGSRDAYLELKAFLSSAIRRELGPEVDTSNPATLRPVVHEHFRRLLAEQPVVLNQAEKRQMLETIINELSLG